MRPLRRASNGKAASSTTEDVEAAPLAAKPEPIHGSAVDEVTLSAVVIITRSQRPVDNQSSATANADAPEAHALLVCIFGPRAPRI